MVGAQEAPDANAHGDPYIPVGTLGVNPTFVQSGVQPNLSWGLEFPAVFQDLAIIGNSGALASTQEVQAEIRILGVCFEEEDTGKDLPAAIWVRIGGAGNFWRLIFYGTNKTANPSKILFKEWILPGTTIDIAARGQNSSGSWHNVVWTIDETEQLEHRTNGGSIPEELASCGGGDELEGFTTAILSEDEEKVEIGPKDLVYFFELSASNPEEPGFDLQDIVALVQFKTKNNNGHGNNADGVDVSNPGQGEGGPNGILDPSGEIDDEIKSLKILNL